MNIPIFKPEDNINEKMLLEIYDNSYEFLKVVLEAFLNGSKKDFEKLTEYMSADDRNHYSIVIHGLKSSAASVGFNDLAELAKHSDFLYKSGEWDGVLSLHDEIIRQLEKAINLVELRLNE